MHQDELGEKGENQTGQFRIATVLLVLSWDTERPILHSCMSWMQSALQAIGPKSKSH